MNPILKSTKLSMLVLTCTVANSAMAAPSDESVLQEAGLTAFEAGTPALAADVNENLRRILDKISNLQPGSSTATVDCSSDRNALRNAVEQGIKEINFSGACDGPLFPSTRTKLNGSGKNTSSINGFKDISIDIYNYDVVIWNQGSILEINDTTINEGSTLDGPTMVGSSQGSEIRLYNVDVNGPNIPEDNSTCLFARQASFRLTDVKITGCNEALGLQNSSFAEIREDSLGATVFQNNRDYWTVHASHNSSLRIKGGTFKSSHLDADPNETEQAIGISYNSTIRLEGGTVEGLAVKRNSSAELRGGEVKDILRVQSSSFAELKDTFTISQSVISSVKPVIRLNASQITVDNLATPLNLSKLKARDGLVEIYGNDVNDSATTIDELSVRRSRLDVEDITIISTVADLSDGSGNLSDSLLDINGQLTMWNSNMWMSDGSIISADSYQGNDCAGEVYQINGDGSETIEIDFPACPITP